MFPPSFRFQSVVPDFLVHVFYTLIGWNKAITSLVAPLRIRQWCRFPTEDVGGTNSNPIEGMLGYWGHVGLLSALVIMIGQRKSFGANGNLGFWYMWCDLSLQPFCAVVSMRKRLTFPGLETFLGCTGRGICCKPLDNFSYSNLKGGTS